MGARNLHDFVSAPGKLLTKGEPDFLHRATHDRWHWKKSAEHDCDFHAAKNNKRCLDFARHDRSVGAP